MPRASRSDGVAMIVATVLCRCALAGVAVPVPPLPPPSDAVVLFDGTNTAAFTTAAGAPVAWKIVDGALEVVPGSGDLVTKQALGSGQYHFEFWYPEGGGSGVAWDTCGGLSLRDRQPDAPSGHDVLDFVGALGPSEWQSADAFYQAPQFDEGGQQTASARVSVVINGVWVPHPIGFSPTPEQPQRPTAPFRLRDEGSPVRFRNLWYRPLDSKRSEHQPVLAPPPADAQVLLGKDGPVGLSGGGNRAFGWTADGAEIEVKDGGGSVYSKRPYGDFQLHLEFRTPEKSQGRGQADGNSGIYIHNLYEVQILNSYDDKEPVKHGCGSLYRVQPPLTNACLPRGEWQSYDILFRAAKVDEQGNVTRKARLSVRHNGIWIHDDLEVPGPTGSASKRPQVERAPFQLQNHGNAVRFRNIWIRELALEDPPPAEQ